MSIERRGSCYVPVCDYCGDELPEEYDFYDAVGAKKAAGWRSHKDQHGEWQDACAECTAQIGAPSRSAKSDFEGVGR